MGESKSGRRKKIRVGIWCGIGPSKRLEWFGMQNKRRNAPGQTGIGKSLAMHPHYVTQSTETNKSNKRPFEKSKYCLIIASQLASPAKGSMFPTWYAAHHLKQTKKKYAYRRRTGVWVDGEWCRNARDRCCWDWRCRDPPWNWRRWERDNPELNGWIPCLCGAERRREVRRKVFETIWIRCSRIQQ